MSKKDDSFKDILKKSGASGIVKVVGIIASLASSILIAKYAGAEAIGLIETSIKFTSILGIFCMLGMRQIIIREIAISLNDKKLSDNSSQLLFSVKFINIIFTLLISVLLIYLTPIFLNETAIKSQLITPLTIFIGCLVPQIYLQIKGAELIGNKKIWQGNLTEKAAHMILTLVFLLILINQGFDITVENIAFCFLFSWASVAIFALLFLNKKYTSPNLKASKRINTWKLNTSFYKDAPPLFISGLSSIITTSCTIVILAIYIEPFQVGIYSIAAKLALLTSLILMILNNVVSPNIAQLYNQKNILGLKRVIYNLNKLLILIAVASTLLIFIFGKTILSVWGEEFIEGYILLLILAFGQFINMCTGSVGVILVMTRNQDILGKITFSMAALIIILNLVIIPSYGTLGAALVYSFVVSFENLLKLIFIKRKLGINPLNIFEKI